MYYDPDIRRYHTVSLGRYNNRNKMYIQGKSTGTGCGSMRLKLIHLRCPTLSMIRRRRDVILRWLGILVGLAFVGHVVVGSLFHFTLPDDINEDDFLSFQPEITEDFPTVAGKPPQIPHILHQTYRSEYVPAKYTQNIRSFMDKNPTWDYFLWTDESARKLITDRHPYLLETWDSYRDNINRADALRYIVLYEFGGVYADLDVNCFRPLDRAMIKYACIIPTEPFEQSAFKNKMPYFLNNAIIMCRPKHPFMKQMLENLHLSRAMYTNVDVAGPMFVTSEFIKYAHIGAGHLYKTVKVPGSSSPYFYKGNIKEDDDNGIYIPNTIYFLDTLNNHFEASHIAYVYMCKRFKQLSNIEQRACVDLKRRGFYRKRSPFTFTEHLWEQSYGPLQRLWNPFGVPLKHIERIVPHYRMY